MSQQGSPFATQTIFSQPEPRSGGTNGLGIAGFICSLIGLLTSCCTCAFPILGLVSLVGLVLSFIAIFRAPRGFAIAGLILGIIAILMTLLGSLMWIGAKGAGGAWEVIKAAGTAKTVTEYRNAHGSYPPSLNTLTTELPAAFIKDSWGNTFVYEVSQDGSQFTIRSMGADGVDGTPDDVSFAEFIDEPGYTPDPIPAVDPTTGPA